MTYPIFSSLTSFTKDLEIASWYIARGILLGYPSPVEISLQRNTHTHNRMCPWYPTRWRHMFCIRSSTIGVSYFSMYYVFTLLFDVPLKIYNSAFRRLLLEFWPIAESAYVQQNIPKLRAYQLHRRPRTLITSSEAEGSCFFCIFQLGNPVGVLEVWMCRMISKTCD